METGAVTAAMDRAQRPHLPVQLSAVYFAAPVTYIGVVQGCFATSLGTRAMVAICRSPPTGRQFAADHSCLADAAPHEGPMVVCPTA